MRLLTVIPIAKGVFKENLSYFTSKKVGAGDLVTIPLRKKSVPAIVLSSQDIKREKALLKKAGFSLKSIKEVRSSGFLETAFVSACNEIAKYYVSHAGAVLKDLIPQKILDKAQYERHAPPTEIKRGRYRIEAYQSSKENRVRQYKTIIREEFASGKSVFFCLPGSDDVKEFSKQLSKGIEEYSVSLHSDMTKKKMAETWIDAIKKRHPILIIATRSFLSIPRDDIGTLIIDRENSSSYKLQTRPYLDIRKAAEIICSNMKIRLIFGDSLLRTETYYKSSDTETHRILGPAEPSIADMKKEREFKIIGEKVETAVKRTIEKGGHSVLLAKRRGYTTTTLCNDCMRTMLCGKCESPLVLHKNNSNKKSVRFVCHKCLSETIVPEKCPYCQGWRLASLGIGTQKTAEEAGKIFPDAKIFRLDSDIAKTRKAGEEIMKKFLDAPGAVLVATEILFSYLNEPVETVAVASIDGMFTLPDFTINEKVLHLLLRLKTAAKKNFIMQTRLPEQRMFDYAIKGNVSAFYKDELESRKEFGYPPFKTIIKITKDGRNNRALRKEAEELEKRLEKWNPSAYPSFIPKIKNFYSWHIMVGLNPQSWPSGQKELHQILSELPPAWKVNVDPESLL